MPQVYMFSHRYADAMAPFIRIKTTQGHELLITADHYLYVNGSLVTAKTVQVGDLVTAQDGQQVWRYRNGSIHVIIWYCIHRLNQYFRF